MNYTFPCYGQLNPFMSHLFSPFSFTQQHFQPTTLIVSDAPHQDQEIDNSVPLLPKLKTQTSINEATESCDPKKAPKKENKPIKKDVRKKKD